MNWGVLLYVMVPPFSLHDRKITGTNRVERHCTVWKKGNEEQRKIFFLSKVKDKVDIHLDPHFGTWVPIWKILIIDISVRLSSTSSIYVK